MDTLSLELVHSLLSEIACLSARVRRVEALVADTRQTIELTHHVVADSQHKLRGWRRYGVPLLSEATDARTMGPGWRAMARSGSTALERERTRATRR
jgi:hypothetical protein